MNNQSLPSSWMEGCLAQICSHPQYGWTCKAQSHGQLRLLRTTDITSGKINWETVPYCSELPKNKEDYYLSDGDIVVSRAGSVGKSFIIKGNLPKAVFASYLVRFKPYIERFYVYYFMQSRLYWSQIEEQSAGIAVPNVNGSKLAKIILPIAPLNEQKRIVDKIEQLFSNLDEGEALLKQVQKQLETYRQSVLKAAVTGELTKEWRKANQHRLEPSESLLKRILKVRRDSWQGRGKYQEPDPPETNNLPNLPGGWVWATLATLTNIKGGVTVDSKRQPKDPVTLPYLRVANVQNGYLNLSEIKNITVENTKAEAFLLTSGDILLNEGGDLDKLGRGCVWREEISPCIHQNHVFRARPLLKELSSDYVSYYTNAFGQSFFMEKGKQSVNLASISLTAISKLPVPVPSPEEQAEIVDVLQDKLSQIDALESWCASELTRSSALRQSILKDAFSGKLAPQDPNDEPASELLKSIQAEKPKAAVKAPVTRGRKKKVTA